MPTRKIAEQLIASRTKRERVDLLAKQPRAEDLALARRLKEICYRLWTTAPVKAQRAALALEALTALNPDEEIAALAAWVGGIADLTRGRLERSIDGLDRSAAHFRHLRKPLEAAQTQVAKLIVLALLGRYDDALRTGRAALKVFEKYGDALAAGKIEKNLGNITARQEDLSRSEKYYLSAIARFERVGDLHELAMCETNLADTYAELHDFRKAEEFYAKARRTAQTAGMSFVEAEIEASRGNLALFRGRYAAALDHLETARRRFADLRVRHRSAVAELEIADIYLELNLIDEALAIYRRVAGALRRLKLQGEEARARANLGKAARLKNDLRRARRALAESARLYVLENNPGGAAGVKLTEADVDVARGDYRSALARLDEAEKLLGRAENPRLALLARWLRGDVLRRVGRFRAAEKSLAATLAAAEAGEQANLAQACLNSLGLLARERGRPAEAERYFGRAVALVETLRAPLAAEEFRMAFLAGKLAPFENLSRLHLEAGDWPRAFAMIEKARARTLSESLDGVDGDRLPAHGALGAKMRNLREELNWFYSRLDRAETGEAARLQAEVVKRERRIAALLRQIGSTTRGRRAATGGEDFDLARLQSRLGPRRALVEYVKFDGRFSAFVVTAREVRFHAGLARESEVLALLEGLRFQFGALRYGRQHLAAFMPELKRRADAYLRRLDELLLAPLALPEEARRLVVVPAGATHYVPFQALRGADDRYAVERREIVYAPSAAVWRTLDEKTPVRPDKALLLGAADEKIPLVDEEIRALREIFPRAETLTGADASFANYTARAGAFDLLHLACHGQFRPDNPLFSSLRLADGSITVKDVCAQRLRAGIVTLSACETGLNQIFAGDEILGLARGFLAAGAQSLVLSLWTVNDEATARLMRDFYRRLQRGASPAASLRAAQVAFIREHLHPYFWSPFALIGKGA